MKGSVCYWCRFFAHDICCNSSKMAYVTDCLMLFRFIKFSKKFTTLSRDDVYLWLPQWTATYMRIWNRKIVNNHHYTMIIWDGSIPNIFTWDFLFLSPFIICGALIWVDNYTFFNLFYFLCVSKITPWFLFFNVPYKF